MTVMATRFQTVKIMVGMYISVRSRKQKKSASADFFVVETCTTLLKVAFELSNKGINILATDISMRH